MDAFPTGKISHLEIILSSVLIVTNFLAFVVGMAVIIICYWNMHGSGFMMRISPSYMEIIKTPEARCGDIVCSDTLVSNTFLYSTVFIITIASLTAFISFVGCVVVVMEHKCMLGVYCATLCAFFIILLVNTSLAATWNFEEKVKNPLQRSILMYDDLPAQNDTRAEALKAIWNQFQTKFKCCGVNSFKDWHQNEATFSKDEMDKSDVADRRFNKPEGCCRNKRDNFAMPEKEVEVCRRDLPSGEDSDRYYFKGCYDTIKGHWDENKALVLGFAITIAVLLFINTLGSFIFLSLLHGWIQPSTS